MSIPRMSPEIWDQIKEQVPIPPPDKFQGCWRLGGTVKVLYNVGERWTLVAMDHDPPPPPPDMGLMGAEVWPMVSGGRLIADFNVIEKGDARYQIHHLRGRPGLAMPVLVQRLSSSTGTTKTP